VGRCVNRKKNLLPCGCGRIEELLRLTGLRDATIQFALDGMLLIWRGEFVRIRSRRWRIGQENMEEETIAMEITSMDSRECPVAN